MMRNFLKKIFLSGNEVKVEMTPGEVAKIRGDEFLAQGDWLAAERCYRDAVRLAPQFAKAHSNLGFVLARQERSSEAEASLLRALELDASNADTHYMLGTLASTQPLRFDEARASFEAALRLEPGFEAAHVGLCALLVGQRELAAARIVLDAALMHCPACAILHRLLGEAEYDDMQFSAAVASHERALLLEPSDAATHAALARALLRLGRQDAAMMAFEQGIALLHAVAAQGDAKAMFNLGAGLMELGRYADARTWFDRSLDLQPDSGETRIARGWLHLLLGEFEAGWLDYRDVSKYGAQKQGISHPLWDGAADLAGKSLLLYADQGMGDTLQLVRYVREARARGASAIYLDVQPPLRTLLAAMHGVTHVLQTGEVLEAFDFQAPLSHLPAAFSTTLSAMPDARPYLAAPVALAQAWRARLGAGAGDNEDGHAGLRAGVVWAGNPKFRSDRQRSMFLRDLLPLFEQPNCRFYLLQKERRTVDRPVLSELLQARHNIVDLAGDLTDFDATAAIIANLDLVITVDTSVAHLAGAMGKPVWIMLPFAPDFRWLLDRADSPWYPGARLFRQPRLGDWAAVVDELKLALASHGRQ